MDEPMKPIWQVVHRDVLIELLNDAISEVVFNAEDDTVQRLTSLRDETEAGTGKVLTLERWKGTA